MSRILSRGGARILSRGVCLSACWDITPPGTRHPQSRHFPRPGTPWTRHTPLGQTPPEPSTPQDHAPPHGAVHAGRYGQQAGGMHPTGMQSYLLINFGFKPHQIPLYYCPPCNYCVGFVVLSIVVIFMKRLCRKSSIRIVGTRVQAWYNTKLFLRGPCFVCKLALRHQSELFSPLNVFQVE